MKANYRDYKEIKGSAASALALEKFIPRSLRHLLLRILVWLSLLLVILIVLSGPLGIIGPDNIRGVLMFAILTIAVLRLIEAFYLSHYVRGLRMDDGRFVNFEAAEIIYNSKKDLLGALLSSECGDDALERCDVARKDWNEFLSGKRILVSAEEAVCGVEDHISLGDLGACLMKADKEFGQFLFREGVSEEQFVGALNWTARLNRQAIQKKRWWSADNLSRLPGIGKHWAVGRVSRLERYGRDLTSAEIEPKSYGDKYLDQLERSLSKNREANAVLVGEEGVGRFDIIERLASKISSGRSLPELEHKRLFLLDAERLMAGSGFPESGEKAALESEIISLLDEAEYAGDIILAILDFPSFIQSARGAGLDLPAIMDKYLAGRAIQVVATSSSKQFYETMERDGRLSRRFEKISVAEPGKTETIEILEDAAALAEENRGLFFTYQALEEIYEGSRKYFQDGIMPEKALDVLSEIAPWALRRGISIITAADVKILISDKSGVPAGEAGEAEKKTLSNLESVLAERIVGQKEAISALGGAMRRARSGVSSGKRPMGSFLFLGPTGVGKTETSKALAYALFGSDKEMIRLDMSEYRTRDSLARLLGSFETGESGVLPRAVKDKPYGVILLDEFEKTNREIMDLFLQVFDEGFFSDAAGRRVNVRNHVIIATSNAESDFIWKMSEEGKNPVDEKEAIINKIVEDGIMKPELLNRFDDTIIFHPLSRPEIRQIAALMLESLRKHLRGEGIELVVSNELLDKVVEHGYDPRFGARPMRRAIQDHVEGPIAEKIIRGELKKGSRVSLV